MTPALTARDRDRRVAAWLLACSALVFAMIVLGGITRLTGSGLSMTEWEPVTGILPPLSDAAWEAEFARYRASPEYRHVNSHMDVHLFKEIYWLEYLHRLLGRVIGLAFLLPFVYFAANGYIRRRDWPLYVAMFALGGLQGLLGWYMVKSGLVDVPAVSQYRLTAHLLAALLIYGFMFWVALSLRNPRVPPRRFDRHDRRQGQDRSGRHPWFGRSVALTALVTLTIISGGFVAGLKAGKLYNTFPRMGDDWLPPGAFALEPGWRNFFENPVLVQFDHRVLALTTLFAVLAFCIGLARTATGTRTATGRNLLLLAVVTQVALGILTLLNGVPIMLAVLHQAVAVLLFTAALWVTHALREPAAEPADEAAARAASASGAGKRLV